MKMSKKLIKGESGFTILEVMISLVIFSLGLLLLMSMLVVSIHGNYWSEKTTLSTQLIRERLEQMKNTPSASLTSGSDVVAGYNRSWTVHALATPGLVEAKVVVRWSDAELRSYACSTVTYIQPK